MDEDLIFLTLPTGREGREEVTIAVSHIAAMRSHRVQGRMSFEDWTEIILKNGAMFDCKIKHSDLIKKVLDAVNLGG